PPRRSARFPYPTPFRSRAAAAVAVLTATTAGLVVAQQDGTVVERPPTAASDRIASDPVARAVANTVATAATTDFSSIVKRYGPADRKSTRLNSSHVKSS